MTAQQELALDATTHLAAYLNAAMERSPEARDAYASLWGVEWTALGCGASINDGVSSEAGTLR